MRLFQNSGIYSSYLRYFNSLASDAAGFEARRRAFLNDRFGALHFLQPVLDHSPDAFFTNGDDAILQNSWAREHGVKSRKLEDILLAQIEDHRTEVWYNLDPMRFGCDFVRRLPGCVRKTICWRAAPSGRADLSAYDVVLGNFPSILDDWQSKGCRVAKFYPAIDPVMGEYGRKERPIDVLFVGSYSRHHVRRARVLEAVAELATSHKVVFCLDSSRLTKLAETMIGSLFLKRHRRPRPVADIAGPPVFGRKLYELIGQSKIVLNGAVDMAGDDRGNMRCFESMGCGSLLLSDAGNYPEGMEPGTTIAVYQSAEEAVHVIRSQLADQDGSAVIALRGRERIANIYNKSAQFKAITDIVARL